MQTLYHKLGGAEAIRATLIKMYEKILNDDRVSLFFSDIDMEKLRRMNTEFVSMAFGAEHHYTGRSLRAAHAKLVQNGLNDSHFDIVASHLAASMEELGVSPELIAEGLAIVESVRSEVLGK